MNSLGKTLALLSASCAWLERYKKERTQSRDECKACRGGGSVGHTENRTLDQNGLLGELNGTDLSSDNSKCMDARSADCTYDAESFSTCKSFLSVIGK